METWGTTSICIRDQHSCVIVEEDKLMEKRRLRIDSQAEVVLRDAERRVWLKSSHKIVLLGK